MKRYQGLLIANGAIMIFAGMMTGFVFAFNLVETITLWPIPGSFDVRIPGDPARWRAAHSGFLMNGLMAFVVGLSLPHLALSRRAQAFVTWGLILAVWGNGGFYVLSALGASGRGLTMGPNKFGGGDLMSQINFLVAYPGAFIAPIVMVILARAGFAAARPEPEDNDPWPKDGRR